MAHHMNRSHMIHLLLCSIQNSCMQQHQYILISRMNRKRRLRLYLRGSCHRNHNLQLRKHIQLHPLHLQHSYKQQHRGNLEFQIHHKYHLNPNPRHSSRHNRILSQQRHKSRARSRLMDQRSYKHLDSSNPQSHFHHRQNHRPYR